MVHGEQAVDVLVGFVRSVHLRRALSAVDPSPKLNFWRVIFGHCTDMAAIEWCKLFGSDDAQYQPVHWKNLISPAQHDNFRTDLLVALDKTQSEWLDYRVAVKLYRDTHAAHRDIRPHSAKRYPDYTPALEAAYFYWDRLLPLAPPDFIFPEDLRIYSTEFEAQAKEVAEIAMRATAQISEKVS